MKPNVTKTAQKAYECYYAAQGFTWGALSAEHQKRYVEAFQQVFVNLAVLTADEAAPRIVLGIPDGKDR